MRHTAVLATLALALVAVATVPVAGLAADAGVVAQTENGTDANETSADISPGERLNGVLGVQGAEIRTEVDSRTFGLQIARAAGNESRAEVVAQHLATVQERIEALEQRKEALQRARENGSLSEGAYRAQIAEVAAETAGARRLANQSENASQGLPAELLEEKGINATAIQTLKDRASELGGREVAAIARSIAGPGVGKRPAGAGPPEAAPVGGDGVADNETAAGNASSGDPGADRGDGRPDDAGGDSGSDDGESPTEATETERRPDGAGTERGQ